MEEKYLYIMQLTLFFVMLPITFKALMSLRIEELFKKNHIWQIQVMFIIFSVILSYFFVDALMGLVRLSLGVAY